MLRASVDGTTAAPGDNQTLNASFSILIGFLPGPQVSFEHEVGAVCRASWHNGESKFGRLGNPCNFFRSGESS